MADHSNRDRALAWWALHPDSSAAAVADHHAEQGLQLRAATLRQWKRRHGLPSVEAARQLLGVPDEAPAARPPAAAPPPARASSTSSVQAADEAALQPAATWEDVHSLVPWPDNPRDNDHTVEAVADSFMRFGYGRTFVAWRQHDKRMIVVGHTARKAVHFNLARHPDRCPPDTPAPHLVPVRWRDDWTDTEARGYAVADNRLAELSGWIPDQLAEQLVELEDAGIGVGLLGWQDRQLEDLLAELRGTATSSDGTEDPDPPPAATDPGLADLVISKWSALQSALDKLAAERGAELVIKLSRGVYVCDKSRASGPVSSWRRPYSEGGAVVVVLRQAEA